VLEQAMKNFALLGAGWVLWLLVGMSVLCVAIGVERIVYMMVNRTPAHERSSSVRSGSSAASKPASSSPACGRG
jgi:hypothetical protein